MDMLCFTGTNSSECSIFGKTLFASGCLLPFPGMDFGEWALIQNIHERFKICRAELARWASHYQTTIPSIHPILSTPLTANLLRGFRNQD
jgi:hypothetical protein